MSWQQELSQRFRLDERQVSAFEHLLALLVSEQTRGLTAVKDPAEIVKLHFFDSLSLIDLPELSQAHSGADIGSGAGFPGLPLAIAKPGLQISLIEAIKKKSAFIAETAQQLGLANTKVIPARAEDIGRSELRESFDIAFARAVGATPEVLEYSLPLLKLGGFALLQRGSREAGDEQLAAGTARELGGRLVRIQKVEPYPTAANLHVWLFEKTSSTPDKYPRRPGMARKRPLKFSS